MNRIARVACVAAATVALVSPTPVAPASPAPDTGARQAAQTYKVTASINTSDVVAGAKDEAVVRCEALRFLRRTA